MTISNLVPLMRYKYGPSVLSLFSPAAVERMEGCTWDPQSEMVVGKYDDEITYLDESDPMATYVTSSIPNTTSMPSPTSPAPMANTPTQPTSNLVSSLITAMDDDSVSTLGNNTTQQRWSPSSAIHLPHSLTQRSPPPQTPTDDASIGTISTLTSRLTTMETQYNQISGAVQDIKSMLVGLAQATHHSTQVEPPTDATTAGRGTPSTGGGS